VIDVSHPDAPHIVGSTGYAGGADQIALRGDFAYVADGYGGWRRAWARRNSSRAGAPDAQCHVGRRRSGSVTMGNGLRRGVQTESCRRLPACPDSLRIEGMRAAKLSQAASAWIG
jgi:hypothetical protein